MKDADFRDNETLEMFKKTGGNILLTTIDDVIDWGRSNSIWPLDICHQLLRHRNDGHRCFPA